MAGRDLPAVGAALTADGNADGSLTIVSTAAFRVGMLGFVSSTTEPSSEVVITEIVSGTVLKVRLVSRPANAIEQGPNLRLNPINYGHSSMAIYDLADNARIDCPSQFVYNEE